MSKCLNVCDSVQMRNKLWCSRCEHRFSRSSTPDASGRFVLLSLERLKKHIAIDVLNRSVTVDAGVTLQELNEALSSLMVFSSRLTSAQSLDRVA